MRASVPASFFISRAFWELFQVEGPMYGGFFARKKPPRTDIKKPVCIPKTL